MAASSPSIRVKSITDIGTMFILMGSPVLFLLLMMATQNKWACFFAVCAMVVAFATGSLIGFVLARWTLNDPVLWAFFFGMAGWLIGGTPTVIWLLP
jgi:hypothetical protein